MGKHYYCDYCNRSFADRAENRKKHLVSLQHQNLVKAHYTMYKDVTTLLKEESSKNPCRRFFTQGECHYGPGCKYTHYSPEGFKILQELASEESAPKKLKKDLPNPDLNIWQKSILSKKRENCHADEKPSVTLSCSLPESLRGIPNLPPSLIPSSYSSNEPSSEWGL